MIMIIISSSIIIIIIVIIVMCIVIIIIISKADITVSWADRTPDNLFLFDGKGGSLAEAGKDLLLTIGRACCLSPSITVTVTI